MFDQFNQTVVLRAWQPSHYPYGAASLGSINNHQSTDPCATLSGTQLLSCPGQIGGWTTDNCRAIIASPLSCPLSHSFCPSLDNILGRGPMGHPFVCSRVSDYVECQSCAFVLQAKAVPDSEPQHWDPCPNCATTEFDRIEREPPKTQNTHFRSSPRYGRIVRAGPLCGLATPN